MGLAAPATIRLAAPVTRGEATVAANSSAVVISPLEFDDCVLDQRFTGVKAVTITSVQILLAGFAPKPLPLRVERAGAASMKRPCAIAVRSKSNRDAVAQSAASRTLRTSDFTHRPSGASYPLDDRRGTSEQPAGARLDPWRC